MTTIHIAEETLTLLPERAAYWERTGTLFIADPHWGKSATFPANADLHTDLARLSRALERTGAQRLIVLGDLIHGRDPAMIDTVRAWRETHAALKIDLVRGNRDQGADDPPDEWRITTMDGPTPGPYFVLNHAPLAPERGYALVGHLHPAVRMRGKGGQSLKLPCFWFGESCGVLPAFGGFTGTHVITPAPEDRVYVVTDEAVMGVG